MTPPGPMVRTATSTGAAQAADWPERKTSPSPDPSRTGLKWTSTTTRRGSSPCLRCPWRVSSDWAIIVSLFSGSQGGPVCGSDREKWGGAYHPGEIPWSTPRCNAAGRCPRLTAREAGRSPWNHATKSPTSPRSGAQEQVRSGVDGFRSASLHSTRGYWLPPASRAVRQ